MSCNTNWLSLRTSHPTPLVLYHWRDTVSLPGAGLIITDRKGLGTVSVVEWRNQWRDAYQITTLSPHPEEPAGHSEESAGHPHEVYRVFTKGTNKGGFE